MTVPSRAKCRLVGFALLSGPVTFGSSACLAGSCPHSGTELFETFAAPEPSWTKGPSSAFQQASAVLSPKTNALSWIFNPAFFFRDAVICVDVIVPPLDRSATMPDSSAGIVFWSTANMADFYAASVLSDGRMSVFHKKGEELLDVISTHPPAFLPADSPSEHSIEIVAVGKVASLKIDNHEITTFWGAPPAMGWNAGLIAAAGSAPIPATWAFHNFSVSTYP